MSERIEVVTADKELRRAASGVHKNVKLINPVKWCAARALVVHCSCTPQRPAFAMYGHIVQVAAVLAEAEGAEERLLERACHRRRVRSGLCVCYT